MSAGRPRSFDWDEARRLRERGLSFQAIAGRLGVTAPAIVYATSESYREATKKASRERGRK